MKEGATAPSLQQRNETAERGPLVKGGWLGDSRDWGILCVSSDIE